MDSEIRELFCKYKLAYDELKRIFELIYNEYSIMIETNPIEHFKIRIKKMESIKEKLQRRNLDYTASNIEENLTDVVGCRIVCSFLSDIEILKDVIRKMDSNGVLKIVNEKDYINRPKDKSGYSSYHIIVSVPVYYNGSITNVMAEVQLRTIAMDMSFSLEHKILYKKGECPKELKDMIRNASVFCKIIDKDLDNVVKSVGNDRTNQLSLDYPFMKRREFDLIRLKYEAALNNIEEKFFDLNRQYNNEAIVNPIEHIKCRLKSDDEIVRKLISKRQVVNIDNIQEYINDFAGVRIVCSFLSDIETLKNEIYTMQDSGMLKIINEKDYINNPKESGYSGYHFLVSVPVYTVNDGFVDVKVEIQLRTIAMEMWASLEEKICYNKMPSSSSREELKRLAGVIGVFDEKLDDIVGGYNKTNLSSNEVKRLVRRKECNNL